MNIINKSRNQPVIPWVIQIMDPAAPNNADIMYIEYGFGRMYDVVKNKCKEPATINVGFGLAHAKNSGV